MGADRNKLKDEVRTIEKSRLPLHDSERIGRCHEVIIPEDQSLKGSKVDGDSSEDSDNDSDRDNDNDNAAAKKRKKQHYDLEVYDDRPFYSMLLKSFITNGSGGDSSSMRAADLIALKKYKRNKVKVDRKASKGRKLRYIVHKKLENFMFPQHVSETSINSERLFQSLFQ